MSSKDHIQKLREELESISDDHSVIGSRLHELKQTLYLIEEKMSPAQEEIFTDFFVFAKDAIGNHFDEEEGSFFQLIQNLPDSLVPQKIASAMVAQLIAEHTLIKAMIVEAEDLFGKAKGGGPSLDWFIASVMSLIDILRAHARKENAVVFFLTQALDEGKSREVRAAYAKLHPPAET